MTGPKRFSIIGAVGLLPILTLVLLLNLGGASAEPDAGVPAASDRSSADAGLAHTTADLTVNAFGPQDAGVPTDGDMGLLDDPATDGGKKRVREDGKTVDGWTRHPLRVWGFNDAMRKFNKESYYGRRYYARQDQVLTGARLILRFDDEPPIALHPDIKALEILNNGNRVALISREALLGGPRKVMYYFNPHELVDENEFLLRFLTYSETPCQPIVEPGTWWIIKDGELQTKARQLELPNDLGLLPVPFFDQRTDREPVVQIAFLEPANTNTLRAAALVASYFGIQTGSAGVRFPTYVGELPDGHVVVLTINPDLREQWGGRAVTGPTLTMMQHPGKGQEMYKVLLVQGRDAAELEQAAARLTSIAWGDAQNTGEYMTFEMLPKEHKTKELSLSKLFLTERDATFGQILNNKDSLTHRGHAGDTLRLEFRISPQLLDEPAELVLLDVQYLQRIPAGYSPAKLDVEFNGIYMMTLPPGDGGLNPLPRTQRLQLPRKMLRGVNRLQFHVSALQHPPLCNSDSMRLIETTVSGDSTLRLVGERGVVRLPDVEAFIYDGLPYTLEPSMDDVAIVLRTIPHPKEIGTALNIISNFAGATGRPATGITFVTETGMNNEALADKEFIVVSAVGNSQLLREWSDRLPLETKGVMRVRPQTTGASTREILSGRRPLSQAEAAERFLLKAEKPGAVMGIESPLGRGHSVIVVTANTVEELPAIIDLQGYTEARLEEGGDLMLLDGEKREVFRLGAAYVSHKVGKFAYVQWVLATVWVLLPLIVLAVALILALIMRKLLERRAEERLAIQGDQQ